MYYHREGSSANESHETQNFLNRCVVGGCSNVTDAKKDISLYFIPFAGDDRDARSEKGNETVGRFRAV